MILARESAIFEEVVFIYYITYLFENLESFFIKIKHKTAISKIADSLAKITLEIYLVQMVVIDLCAEHLALQTINKLTLFWALLLFFFLQ